METKKIVTLAVFVALTLSQLALFAQAPPAGNGSGAPIDGGASLLIAGAAAYGYRKLKKQNAKTGDQPSHSEPIVENYEKSK